MMRGVPVRVAAEIGDQPTVIEIGTVHATVKLHNAHVTLHGTVGQREELIRILALEHGLQVYRAGQLTVIDGDLGKQA